MARTGAFTHACRECRAPTCRTAARSEPRPTTHACGWDTFMRQGIHLIQAWPLQALETSDLKVRAFAEGRYIDLEDETAYPASTVTMLATQTLRPKNISVAQLQQGICWLLWNLYEPANMAIRLRRLLQDFEQSPQRDKVTTPPFFMTSGSLGIALRFLRYVILEASAQDRRDVLKLLRTVRGFAHPHRYQMAVSAFLFSRNMHHILKREMSHIASFEYPTISRLAAHLSAADGGDVECDGGRRAPD